MTDAEDTEEAEYVPAATWDWSLRAWRQAPARPRTPEDDLAARQLRVENTKRADRALWR